MNRPGQSAERPMATGLSICAKCRSENIRRSYSRVYDLPLLPLFMPIRCRDCHARFYMFRFGKAAVLLHT